MTNQTPSAELAGELAPCPFCGGRGITHRGSLPQEWAVSCTQCDCRPRIGWPKSEAEAITAWNQRTTQADNVLRSDDLAAFERIASIIERHNGRQSEKVEDARLIARERIAALKASPTTEPNPVRPTPPVHPGDRWIERWCGSGMSKGSSIWTVDALGCHKNMVEHVGGDEETHRSVRRIVAAHNATLSEPNPEGMKVGERDVGDVLHGIDVARQRLAPLMKAGEDAIWRPAQFAYEVLGNAMRALTDTPSHGQEQSQ